MHPQPILHFWFEELTPKQHFVKDAALDETLRAQFGDRLAEIAVLDKTSRTAEHYQ